MGACGPSQSGDGTEGRRVAMVDGELVRRKKQQGNNALTGGVAIGLGSWSAVIEEDVEAQFSTVLDGDRRQQRWLTTAVQMRGAGVGEAGARVSGSDGTRERNGVGLLLLCPRSG
jgi:hypothetical protein